MPDLKLSSAKILKKTTKNSRNGSDQTKWTISRYSQEDFAAVLEVGDGNTDWCGSEYCQSNYCGSDFCGSAWCPRPNRKQAR